MSDDTVSKPNRVFYLSHPEQLFRKLCWEVENFQTAIKNQNVQARDHEISAFHAFNAAVTSWHLTDWVWTSLSPEARREMASTLDVKLTSNSFGDLKAIQKALATRCLSLEICREIANGSKHLENNPKSDVNAEVKWDNKFARAGELRAGQPLQTSLYEFIVRREDKLYRMTDVLEDILKYWHRVLHDLGFAGEILIKVQHDYQISRAKKSE